MLAVRALAATLSLFVLALATPAGAIQIANFTMTPEQVVPTGGGIDPSGQPVSALVTVTFDDIEPRLDYSIEFTGVDVLDLTGLHIHIGPTGSNGPHALNIFALPSQDDADVILDIFDNTITGSYGDEDQNLDAVGGPGRDAGDSVTLSSVLADLAAGNLYLAAHTAAFPAPNTGILRGQIPALPEPGAGLLLASALLVWGVRSRRAR